MCCHVQYCTASHETSKNLTKSSGQITSALKRQLYYSIFLKCKAQSKTDYTYFASIDNVH